METFSRRHEGEDVPRQDAKCGPHDPVRETSLERLMLAVLCDKTQGMSAIYTETGTGKSFATLLSAAEVAKTTTDFFVVLQNDLTDSLRLCFRISEVSSPASIATSFSIALDKSIKLCLVFDNVLDRGVSSDAEKDILNALARGDTKSSSRCRRRKLQSPSPDSMAARPS